MAGEHYGIDAPTVVRNLALGGAALVVVGLVLPHWPAAAAFGPNCIAVGVPMLVAAAWMLSSSLWLKKLVMRRLLDERAWSGSETMLDVGAGRGLVAIAAARRAPRGRIHAVDLWQAVDLSGNNPAGLRRNAVAAGVNDRLQVDTGDARSLPYPDEMFDVVTSMTVIHNIPDAAGRKQAIAEIWRVTKPGGQILIFDIRHARSYLKQLRALGTGEVKLVGPILLWGPVGWRFSAYKAVAARAEIGDALGPSNNYPAHRLARNARSVAAP
jgi:arsenite methyltransferase